MSFNIKWIKFPSLSALSPIMALDRSSLASFHSHVFNMKSRSSTLEFRDDLTRVDREVSVFTLCSRISYVRKHKYFFSLQRENTILWLVHISWSLDQVTWRVINDFICIQRKDAADRKWKQISTHLYHQLGKFTHRKVDSYSWKTYIYRSASHRCRFRKTDQDQRL